MPITRSQNGMQRGESTLTVTSATTSEVRTTGEEITIEQSTSTSAASQSEQALTLTPAGYTRRAASRTVSKASSRRLAEAREELARCELRKAQAATHLARLRLEAETEDEDSVIEDVNYDHEERVANWMRSSEQKPEEIETKSDIRAIADAIKEVMTNHVMPQPKYIQELPIFEGDSSEWTAFRVVYEDTSPMFSDVQNMARLRKAIKGTARESIKSLLYSEATPEEVINALRRRFGRLDALVLAELEKLKALHRTTENPSDICVFASQINNSVAAIKGLKKPQYLYSPEIMKIIIEKMPAILRFRWYDYTAAREEESFSDIQTISNFLNLEADKCGAFAVLEDSKSVRPSATIKRPVKQATFNIAEKRRPEEIECPVCEGNHKLKDCQGFLKAAVNDRWETVKRLKVCFKCLVGKHRKEKCRRPPCKLCRTWHHSLLHVTSESEQCHKEAATKTATVHTISTPKAILKMLKVEIYGPTGSKQVLALLDEGSTVTLLDENVAASIGIKGPRETLNIETIGGGQMKNHESMIVDIKVKGIRQCEKSTLKRARTIKELKLTPQFIDKTRIQKCHHLRGLLQDVCYEAEAPKLLIGQDNWQYIVSLQMRRGKPGQPVASRTKLGWVIHGYDSNGVSPINYVNTCAHARVVEDKINQPVREYLIIESLGIQPKKPSTAIEQRVLEILERNSQQLEDDRSEVGLLWKRKDVQLPNNFSAAFNRFQGIEKYLREDAKFKNEYSTQIDLLKSNYAEEVTADCTSNKKLYLPHFSVKKKLRIVFDGAANHNRVSLNDILLCGPDFRTGLQSILGVLLRVRLGLLSIAVDKKEMLPRVNICEEDRNSLRFLWRKDKKALVKDNRMLSVILGAASPCTTIYIKNRNAKAFVHKYPEAAQAIEQYRYMDNYLQSFYCVDDYQRVIQPVNLIYMKAHFELRRWASNKRVIIEDDTEARKSYLEHIGRIKDNRLPRCVSLFCTEGELHTVADASKTAYAAATGGNGEYLENLVDAKSRVKSRKSISTPRLEMQATLLGTEHIDNSPITNLTDNSKQETLKPNYILIGRSSGSARILHFPDAKLVGRKDLKSVQRLSDHFRKRLLREYLPKLLPRKTTRRQKGEQLQPGDVVLIVKRTLPRCTWPRYHRNYIPRARRNNQNRGSRNQRGSFTKTIVEDPDLGACGVAVQERRCCARGGEYLPGTATPPFYKGRMQENTASHPDLLTCTATCGKSPRSEAVDGKTEIW
ncbi:uncharacterized protein LOC123689628 [Pieris rapae]|uniref:uncharacterized protein LOC123689628 n=1 Tax=Pieris rapae TaxID=64459 RepID=UPI001E27C756|nr:uncharacterized protein LOC123689628 [Pieris rapae]